MSGVAQATGARFGEPRRAREAEGAESVQKFLRRSQESANIFKDTKKSKTRKKKRPMTQACSEKVWQPGKDNETKNSAKTQTQYLSGRRPTQTGAQGTHAAQRGRRPAADTESRGLTSGNVGGGGVRPGPSRAPPQRSQPREGTASTLNLPLRRERRPHPPPAWPGRSARFSREAARGLPFLHCCRPCFSGPHTSTPRSGPRVQGP